MNTMILIFAASISGQPLQLVTNKEHKSYLEFIPQTTDEHFEELRKGHITFYTEKEMPRAYQHDGGIHNAYHNISAAQRDPEPFKEHFGNANIEFPWGKPAGTHNSTVKTLRFMVLPQGSKIKYWTRQERFSLDPFYTLYEWSYPDGTVFGEILTLNHKENGDYTFEMRTRSKSNGSWSFKVFRPYPTYESLSEKIKKIRPWWKLEGHFVTLIRELEKPTNISVEKLKNKHPKEIINVTSSRQNLPFIPEGTVKILLNQPFHVTPTSGWRSDLEFECSAPSTTEEFHIVPKDYAGHHIRISKQDCMKCHNGTLVQANDFEGFSFGKIRDWYGHVRGSDGIFSFHLFDKSCISSNGFRNQVILNPKLENFIERSK